MMLPAYGTLAFLLPTLAIALACVLVQALRRRPLRRLLLRIAAIHAVLLPLHAFVTVPCAMGLVGSRFVHTRSDEAGYAGPRILADGTWELQTRVTLRAERDGSSDVDPALAAAAAARRRWARPEGATEISAWKVDAAANPPRAVAVLVHGLFRGALELEPVGAMFRRAGCEVWLVEMPNHGASGRVPATFGLHESHDLARAIAEFRRAGEMSAGPLVLFGVSMGTAAVSLALPHVEGLAGLALDAPMEDLLSAGHRMLQFHREEDRRNLIRMVEPWRSMTLGWLGIWSGFRLADVRPQDVLASLPSSLPVLVVGGALDDRMPEAVVRNLFAALPMPEGTKELWIRDGSGHGNVWTDDPRGYEQRIRALLDRVRSSAR
ncbi:MAG: hypothetical protein RL148_2926 [Planctomycetota bacterium]|jgi:pimeloyl-ACP methyl ester carboxylesterase